MVFRCALFFFLCFSISQVFGQSHLYQLQQKERLSARDFSELFPYLFGQNAKVRQEAYALLPKVDPRELPFKLSDRQKLLLLRSLPLERTSNEVVLRCSETLSQAEKAQRLAIFRAAMQLTLADDYCGRVCFSFWATLSEFYPELNAELLVYAVNYLKSADLQGVDFGQRFAFDGLGLKHTASSYIYYYGSDMELSLLRQVPWLERFWLGIRDGSVVDYQTLMNFYGVDDLSSPVLSLLVVHAHKTHTLNHFLKALRRYVSAQLAYENDWFSRVGQLLLLDNSWGKTTQELPVWLVELLIKADEEPSVRLKVAKFLKPYLMWLKRDQPVRFFAVIKFLSSRQLSSDQKFLEMTGLRLTTFDHLGGFTYKQLDGLPLLANPTAFSCVELPATSEDNTLLVLLGMARFEDYTVAGTDRFVDSLKDLTDEKEAPFGLVLSKKLLAERRGLIEFLERRSADLDLLSHAELKRLYGTLKALAPFSRIGIEQLERIPQFTPIILEILRENVLKEKLDRERTLMDQSVRVMMKNLDADVFNQFDEQFGITYNQLSTPELKTQFTAPFLTVKNVTFMTQFVTLLITLEANPDQIGEAYFRLLDLQGQYTVQIPDAKQFLQSLADQNPAKYGVSLCPFISRVRMRKNDYPVFCDWLQTELSAAAWYPEVALYLSIKQGLNGRVVSYYTDLERLESLHLKNWLNAEVSPEFLMKTWKKSWGLKKHSFSPSYLRAVFKKYESWDKADLAANVQRAFLDHLVSLVADLGVPDQGNNQLNLELLQAWKKLGGEADFGNGLNLLRLAVLSNNTSVLNELIDSSGDVIGQFLGSYYWLLVSGNTEQVNRLFKQDLQLNGVLIANWELWQNLSESDLAGYLAGVDQKVQRFLRLLVSMRFNSDLEEFLADESAPTPLRHRLLTLAILRKVKNPAWVHEFVDELSDEALAFNKWAVSQEILNQLQTSPTLSTLLLRRCFKVEKNFYDGAPRQFVLDELFEALFTKLKRGEVPKISQLAFLAQQIESSGNYGAIATAKYLWKISALWQGELVEPVINKDNRIMGACRFLLEKHPGVANRLMTVSEQWTELERQLIKKNFFEFDTFESGIKAGGSRFNRSVPKIRLAADLDFSQPLGYILPIVEKRLSKLFRQMIEKREWGSQSTFSHDQWLLGEMRSLYQVMPKHWVPCLPNWSNYAQPGNFMQMEEASRFIEAVEQWKEAPGFVRGLACLFKLTYLEQSLTEDEQAFFGPFLLKNKAGWGEVFYTLVEHPGFPNFLQFICDYLYELPGDANLSFRFGFLNELLAEHVLSAPAEQLAQGLAQRVLALGKVHFGRSSKNLAQTYPAIYTVLSVVSDRSAVVTTDQQDMTLADAGAVIALFGDTDAKENWLKTLEGEGAITHPAAGIWPWYEVPAYCEKVRTFISEQPLPRQRLLRLYFQAALLGQTVDESFIHKPFPKEHVYAERELWLMSGLNISEDLEEHALNYLLAHSEKMHDLLAGYPTHPGVINYFAARLWAGDWESVRKFLETIKEHRFYLSITTSLYNQVDVKFTHSPMALTAENAGALSQYVYYMHDTRKLQGYGFFSIWALAQNKIHSQPTVNDWSTIISRQQLEEFLSNRQNAYRLRTYLWTSEPNLTAPMVQLLTN